MRMKTQSFSSVFVFALLSIEHALLARISIYLTRGRLINTKTFILGKLITNDIIVLSCIQSLSHKSRSQCWLILCDIFMNMRLVLWDVSDLITFFISLYKKAGWSSGQKLRLRNQMSRVQILVMNWGFCDEQLLLLTSHGRLYIINIAYICTIYVCLSVI
jgi:hypothetical protein